MNTQFLATFHSVSCVISFLTHSQSEYVTGFVKTGPNRTRTEIQFTA